MTPSLMPAGPDVQRMLDPSSMRVSLSLSQGNLSLSLSQLVKAQQNVSNMLRVWIRPDFLHTHRQVVLIFQMETRMMSKSPGADEGGSGLGVKLVCFPCVFLLRPLGLQD